MHGTTNTKGGNVNLRPRLYLDDIHGIITRSIALHVYLPRLISPRPQNNVRDMDISTFSPLSKVRISLPWIPLALPTVFTHVPPLSHCHSASQWITRLQWYPSIHLPCAEQPDTGPCPNQHSAVQNITNHWRINIKLYNAFDATDYQIDLLSELVEWKWVSEWAVSER